MTDCFDELFYEKVMERRSANMYPQCTGLSYEQYREASRKVDEKLRECGFGNEGKKEEDLDEE